MYIHERERDREGGREREREREGRGGRELERVIARGSKCMRKEERAILEPIIAYQYFL